METLINDGKAGQQTW